MAVSDSGGETTDPVGQSLIREINERVHFYVMRSKSSKKEKKIKPNILIYFHSMETV